MCHKNMQGGGLNDVYLKHPQSSTNVNKAPNFKQRKPTLTFVWHSAPTCVSCSLDIQHLQQSGNTCRQQINQLETPPNPTRELVLCAFFWKEFSSALASSEADNERPAGTWVNNTSWKGLKNKLIKANKTSISVNYQKFPERTETQRELKIKRKV